MADDEAPDLIHHWCCNPDTALCGEDLRDGEVMEVDSPKMCVVCVDLAPQPCDITCPLVVFT